MEMRKDTISFTIPHWFFVVCTFWLVGHWVLTVIDGALDLYLRAQ